MAYMRQAGEISPKEALLFHYWTTILQLLKLGIAWEAIMNFTEEEVVLILGIEMANAQREEDAQMKEMAKSAGNRMRGI